MKNILTQLRSEAARLAKDDSGQDFVEYALVTAFVVSMAVVIVGYDFTPSISSIWARINGVLHTAGGA